MQKSIKGYALAFTLQTLLLSELTAMDVDLNSDNKENLLLTTNTPKKEEGISDAILLKENIIPPGRDIIVLLVILIITKVPY